MCQQIGIEVSPLASQKEKKRSGFSNLSVWLICLALELFYNIKFVLILQKIHIMQSSTFPHLEVGFGLLKWVFEQKLFSGQNRVKQMPFTSWVIRPTSSCTALLTLKTPMLDILLNIGDGWCQLLEPQIAECKDIQAQKLRPKVLLQVIKFPLTSINILY
jgi:hypothetical protein